MWHAGRAGPTWIVLMTFPSAAHGESQDFSSPSTGSAPGGTPCQLLSYSALLPYCSTVELEQRLQDQCLSSMSSYDGNGDIQTSVIVCLAMRGPMPIR